MIKVWPLVPGLKGYDATGKKITLPTGAGRWMTTDKAREAEEAGDVQIMAGLSVRDLKTPSKRRRYKTRDMKAEG